MARAHYTGPSVKKFKEGLITDLGHLIAGIPSEKLQNTRAHLYRLYLKVDEYLARTRCIRKELFQWSENPALYSPISDASSEWTDTVPSSPDHPSEPQDLSQPMMDSNDPQDN